jgi:hypothetical protein
LRKRNAESAKRKRLAKKSDKSARRRGAKNDKNVKSVRKNVSANMKKSWSASVRRDGNAGDAKKSAFVRNPVTERRGLGSASESECEEDEATIDTPAVVNEVGPESANVAPLRSKQSILRTLMLTMTQLFRHSSQKASR